MEDMNGSSLFNSMLQDDPEAVKPQFLPGVAPLLQTYLFLTFFFNIQYFYINLVSLTMACTFEDQVVEVWRCFFDLGLEEHQKRESELNAFFSGQKEAETYHREKALQILAEFNEEHREASRKIDIL